MAVGHGRVDGPAGAGQHVGDADGRGHATSSVVECGCGCRSGPSGPTPGARRGPRRPRPARCAPRPPWSPAIRCRSTPRRRPGRAGGVVAAGRSLAVPGAARKVAWRSLVTSESSSSGAGRPGQEAVQLGGDPGHQVVGRRPRRWSAAETDTARYCGPDRSDGQARRRRCGRTPTARASPGRPGAASGSRAGRRPGGRRRSPRSRARPGGPGGARGAGRKHLAGHVVGDGHDDGVRFERPIRGRDREPSSGGRPVRPTASTRSPTCTSGPPRPIWRGRGRPVRRAAARAGPGSSRCRPPGVSVSSPVWKTLAAMANDASAAGRLTVGTVMRSHRAAMAGGRLPVARPARTPKVSSSRAGSSRSRRRSGQHRRPEPEAGPHARDAGSGAASPAGAGERAGRPAQAADHGAPPGRPRARPRGCRGGPGARPRRRADAVEEAPGTASQQRRNTCWPLSIQRPACSNDQVRPPSRLRRSSRVTRAPPSAQSRAAQGRPGRRRSPPRAAGRERRLVAHAVPSARARTATAAFSRAGQRHPAAEHAGRVPLDPDQEPAVDAGHGRRAGPRCAGRAWAAAAGPARTTPRPGPASKVISAITPSSRTVEIGRHAEAARVVDRAGTPGPSGRGPRRCRGGCW